MVYVDNKVALRQLEVANAALLSRSALRSDSYLASGKKSIAKDGKFHPRVLTIVRHTADLCLGLLYKFFLQGGDHTITLPLLRGVAGIYGPVR